MYEEVTLMKPFRRKTLVLIGASGVARRSLKQKILNADPDQFASPLPHTSRPKRAEEDSGMRYWFVDREDMEYSIRNHEFLEYGELKVFCLDIKALSFYLKSFLFWVRYVLTKLILDYREIYTAQGWILLGPLLMKGEQQFSTQVLVH